MALRRPANFQRRAPGWRRSGDESYWDNLISEEEPLPQVPRPSRRPQSAIEGGGQLDTWLEHLRMMESKVRPDISNASYADRTTSMPVLDSKQRSYLPFSTSSSSCGSPSLCESSPGSQDSLQAGLLLLQRRRGSWEKAHITQSPKKEQAQLSYLAPVKIGWLPVQRRVMMVASDGSQNQGSNSSAGQVKLKKPLTPTLQRTGETPIAQDAETGRSHNRVSALCVKTWRTPDRDSPDVREVPDKPSFHAEQGGRRVGWQSLRTSWKASRVAAFPGGCKSSELSTGTTVDSGKKCPLTKTTSPEPLKHYHTTSADPSGQLQMSPKSQSPVQRASSVQPIKATAFFGISASSGAPHTLDNPSVTTRVPQSKTPFSSIAISSKKVSRSASFSGSNSSSMPSTPGLDQQPMDPNSRQMRVQRKATIIKVTDKKVTSTLSPSTSRPGTPPACCGLDVVVRRRKATIIKVTEHRESYSPAKTPIRNPEFRHSYTEGLHKSQENGSDNAAPRYHCLDPGPNSSTTSNTSPSSPKKHSTLHRSTFNFVVSSPPATTPAPSEVSSKAVGQRSDRPKRPLSCYGDLTGHTEPSEEIGEQSAASKWSFGPPQGNRINPVSLDRGFISPGKEVKEAGQPVEHALSPPTEEEEGMPPSVEGKRRASPSLTLITAPDPHHSQEEVLAFNAAAIIANIKLQRQLSKKKTPCSYPEDSAASLQGNTVTDGRKNMKTSSEQPQHQNQPHAESAPLRLEHERSSETISLRQALQRSRPDFISRSQSRVQELERKAQERRHRSSLEGRQLQQKRACSTNPTSVNGNLVRQRDRGISWKETTPRSRK
uniref:ALMS motif domain-containing protein n=1 Tax=Nothobranchius kadleci TaxID=1051664 RepID=A0A1A8CCN2_NOTKA